MPRHSKLTPDMQSKIVTRLAAGSTVQATCDSVGIAESTYYRWVAVGDAYASGLDHEDMPRLIVDREAWSEFSEAVTRAQADGLIQAAIRFREGMNPSESESVTTETVTETKLRKVKKDGGIVEEPFEATKTTTRRTVTHTPGDWRAAMEYLARRDPANWANAQKHGGMDGGAIQFQWSQVMQVLTDDDDNFA